MAPRLFNSRENKKSLKLLYLEENMFFYKNPWKIRYGTSHFLNIYNFLFFNCFKYLLQIQSIKINIWVWLLTLFWKNTALLVRRCSLYEFRQITKFRHDFCIYQFFPPKIFNMIAYFFLMRGSLNSGPSRWQSILDLCQPLVHSFLRISRVKKLPYWSANFVTCWFFMPSDDIRDFSKNDKFLGA